MNEGFESREAGLERRLSTRLLAMLTVGQSIGTGLFLGSGIAVQLAGPGVVLTYAIGAAITLCVMRALSEMTVAHPMAGSFGAHAEHYLNPLAGWVTRYTYSLAQVVAIGSQVVAVAIYCRFWFPAVPAWFWIAGFSVLVLAVNALDVGRFGEFEFWFALVKVGAIVLFLLFGAALLAGVGVERQPPAAPAGPGFVPHGFKGVWLAVAFAIFSYYGLEIAAVSSGEARDPRASVPRAMKIALGGLAVCYTGSVAVLVALVRWDRVGIDESPFVGLYRAMGVPAAPDVMNFVVITAALSSINSNVYVVSRTLFSLARSGQAPAALGILSHRGVPVRAVLAGGAGLLAAAALEGLLGDSAFVYLLGSALFGGIFCWLVILATHIRFRAARGGTRRTFPYGSAVGFAALTAVLVTMGFVDTLRISWVAGVPSLLLIAGAYFVAHPRRRRTAS